MTDQTFNVSQLGLANILGQNNLTVPPNQRDYSWTSREVKQLFQDFARSIASNDTNYFLGTIVTILRPNGTLEVVDGQQRLATTAILLAEIRNYLMEKEPVIAEFIETGFLTVIDPQARARLPRLQLNLDDNDYFRARLTNEHPCPFPSKTSHELIDKAFSEASVQVQNIVAGHNEQNHGDVLNTWIGFMQKQALAVLLRVPKDADAYRMFETLNDRGLRTSQSDLVKNYLFGCSDDRIAEVQQRWSLMRGALETIEDDDITTRFLRHSLILLWGFIREHEVYDAVQNLVKASQASVKFSGQLEALSVSYVAIHNDDHELWNQSDAARKAVKALMLINIKPLKPVVLAITDKFTNRDACKALNFCVSLGVRLMIANRTRTGAVEEGLAVVAHCIYTGKIATFAEFKTQLEQLTPSNRLFFTSFAGATVSNHKLARYYLRSMELAVGGQQEPWHIPNDDKGVINLEHILPQNPKRNWPQFTQDEVKLYYRRIGNLCLLQARENSSAKSASFEGKLPIYKKSEYALTSHIADHDGWTPATINARQEKLAEIALKTWPV